MASVGRKTSTKVMGLLTAPSGLNENLTALGDLEGIGLQELTARQIVDGNVPAELMEKNAGAKYPAVYVYCQTFSNTLREKFRLFSGKAGMCIEVRASQDRLEGLEQALQIHVDAVTRVLDQNRGDWESGMFYSGGYQAEFGPVKHGGRNFIQTAKVTFEVEVSI